MALNNTVYAQKELLFFNRMEKVGSQSMSTLLIALSRINNFTPHRNAPVATKKITETLAEEKALAVELSSIDEASSYVEHANWINFTEHDLAKPIYMNLVRHPIEKIYTIKPIQLNNTVKAEQEVLFFNRLEKVGSQSLSQLIITLSIYNKFIPHRNAPYAIAPILQSPEEQKLVAEEISELGAGVSYVEHINWINFTTFNLPKPIYINLARHPIDKVVSAYYYIRHPAVYGYYVKNNNATLKEKEYFDISFNDCVKQSKIKECIFDSKNPYNADWRRFAMHFCGNAKICKEFNSHTAMQIAKRNIEQEYAVVGSWEDTNITLTVLEHYIPRFFRGATKLFYSDVEKFHKNATPHSNELDPEVEAKLKVQFAFEIELYNFYHHRITFTNTST
ncbi:heparan sulfate 2-O-sulfotransferase pipe-like [Teleopsis dalmanni]|uniref:heparan sulfate 2-O-sulfotransferase pipe-like n=1 Tax=Teleopsis dalmanni TaxID=139649 RepID=UPI0018CCCCB6|nr:heparan sulfate 2-O-sulfotransferase pipe-like [Teleopsis dalmanni]